jgi:hypothetical protein
MSTNISTNRSAVMSAHRCAV